MQMKARRQLDYMGLVASTEVKSPASQKTTPLKHVMSNSADTISLRKMKLITSVLCSSLRIDRQVFCMHYTKISRCKFLIVYFDASSFIASLQRWLLPSELEMYPSHIQSTHLNASYEDKCNLHWQWVPNIAACEAKWWRCPHLQKQKLKFWVCEVTSSPFL